MKITILLAGLLFLGVALASDFDIQKALQKCYAVVPTDKYGSWVDKEYQRLKEDCHNAHPDPFCRKLCFITSTPHHPIFSIIKANESGEWSLQHMSPLATFDIVGIDVVSNSTFKPAATPDNANPEPISIKAANIAITEKLNKKVEEQCNSKVFTAADGKADTCEKLGEGDKKKLAELVECIENALIC